MLEFCDISYCIGKNGPKKKVLDRLSFRIKSGSFVAITGPNGSGKSTLAEILMGIKKPTSGKVVLDGKDITHLDITERAKIGMAFSFQKPVELKGMNVYELLSIASGELISQNEAEGYLKKVGLAPDDYLWRGVDTKLSGGELKRVEIASVLARKAKVTIFDEPEAGIDLWSFSRLAKVFTGLKTNDGIIIVISHQERLLKIADKVIVLENGRVRAQGKPDKVLSMVVGDKNGIR